MIGGNSIEFSLAKKEDRFCGAVRRVDLFRGCISIRI